MCKTRAALLHFTTACSRAVQDAQDLCGSFRRSFSDAERRRHPALREEIARRLKRFRDSFHIVREASKRTEREDTGARVDDG